MITPLDIQSKIFKKKMGGYERTDVDDFFALVGEEYDKLYTENATLRDRINGLAEAVKQYKTMEDTLQDTLVIAQKTGEEVKQAAFEKGEAIIKEAEVKAQEILSKARAEADSARAETSKIISSFEACKAELLSILNSEIAILQKADCKDIKQIKEN